MPERPPRIFLVEDSLADIRLLEGWLKLSGFAHELRTVRDGATALTQLLESADTSDSSPAAWPDVLLFDVHLPGLSGIELAQRIKSQDPYRKIPLLVFIDPTLPEAAPLLTLPRCQCRAKPRDGEEYRALVASIRQQLLPSATNA